MRCYIMMENIITLYTFLFNENRLNTYKYCIFYVYPAPVAATGHPASKMQQKSPLLFSIVAARGVATDDVKKALDSKLEDIVYKTSVSFTEDLDASRLQMLLQLQSADVKVNVGQFTQL